MSYAYVSRIAPNTTSLRPSLAYALRQTGMALGDALSRLSMLLHDSREGLATKDEQLASYGVVLVTPDGILSGPAVDDDLDDLAHATWEDAEWC